MHDDALCQIMGSLCMCVVFIACRISALGLTWQSASSRQQGVAEVGLQLQPIERRQYNTEGVSASATCRTRMYDTRHDGTDSHHHITPSVVSHVVIASSHQSVCGGHSYK